MARPRTNIAPRILRAARDRFLREGVDGASLRRIARDARTSIGMVYYYFPTKEDLFAAVVEEVYSGLLADMAVALAPDVPVDRRLDRLYVRIGRMSDDEAAVLRLVIRETLVSSSRRARLLARFLHGHIPLGLATLGEGIAGGTLTDRHAPALLGIAAVSLGVFPQVLRRLVGDAIPDELGLPGGEALSHALCDLLLRGIGGGKVVGKSTPSQARMRAT